MLNLKWLFTVSIVSMIVGYNMHAMDDVYTSQCAADYKKHVRLQAKHASHQVKKEVCTPIKTLHGAPKQEFKKIVDAMRAKDLTTCACIKFLTKEKNEKVLRSVQQEFGLTNETIKTFKQQIKNDRQKRQPIELQFDDSLSSELQTIIKKRAQEFNVKALTPVNVKGNDDYSGGYVNTHFENLPTLVQIQTNLNLNKVLLNKLGQDISDAMISHELIHITKNHGLQRQRLECLLNIIPLKFIAAQESEATRIPAACSDCKTAKNMISLVELMGSDNANNPQKELQWAQTIHTLRTIEEELKESA